MDTNTESPAPTAAQPAPSSNVEPPPVTHQAAPVPNANAGAEGPQTKVASAVIDDDKASAARDALKLLFTLQKQGVNINALASEVKDKLDEPEPDKVPDAEPEPAKPETKKPALEFIAPDKRPGWCD